MIGEHIASLIIWDEAPMTHHYTLEAGECSLRDLCNQNRTFEEKLVIFRGNFRQILHVVTKESSNKRVIRHNMTKNYVYWKIFDDIPDAWLVHFQE